MTFNSFAFLIFFPLVLGGYFLSRKIGGKTGERMRWIFLLCASYFFYMYSQWRLVWLILFTTVVSWLSSLVIQNRNETLARAEADGTADDALRKKIKTHKTLCLLLTLITSLGVLFYFKYINFILGSASSLVSLFSGREAVWSIEGVLLPVGISFYTFQTLSYAIDVYRGNIETERHFGYYALFVSFFPQLVAGPIERPQNLLPQLKTPPPVYIDDVKRGISKLSLGFFKKLVVADLISVYVNSIYNGLDTPGVVPALGVVISTALFAVQIYCDFSGYTDIAIGCARLMGIRLMKNFDHPYTAKTVREFWNRWHLSLSTWFRDYIYFPLGGSHCSKAKHLRNVMIVFLISGLWHGAAWTYVIWGAIHGLYRMIGILTLPARNRLLSKMKLSPESKLVGAVRTTVTFILVDFAWLFFRANNTSDMITLLRTLVTPACWRFSVSEVLGILGFNSAGMIITVLSFVLLLMLDRVIKHGDEPDGSDILYMRGSAVIVVWCVIFAWTILLKNDLSSTFIYFQF